MASESLAISILLFLFPPSLFVLLASHILLIFHPTIHGTNPILLDDIASSRFLDDLSVPLSKNLFLLVVSCHFTNLFTPVRFIYLLLHDETVLVRLGIVVLVVFVVFVG